MKVIVEIEAPLALDERKSEARQRVALALSKLAQELSVGHIPSHIDAAGAKCVYREGEDHVARQVHTSRLLGEKGNCPRCRAMPGEPCNRLIKD